VLFIDGVPKVIYDDYTPKGGAVFASASNPRGINRKGATVMQNYKFNVGGKERKKLVEAISEILEVETVYQKAPTYSYQIGNLVVDKEGTIIGEIPAEFLTALAERGFVPEGNEPEETAETEIGTFGRIPCARSSNRRKPNRDSLIHRQPQH